MKSYVNVSLFLCLNLLELTPLLDMCSLNRGSQFKYFTTSKTMFAMGAHQPKGGALGDTYGFYVIFDVESIIGLHRAFDYAEVCGAILLFNIVY